MSRMSISIGGGASPPIYGVRAPGLWRKVSVEDRRKARLGEDVYGPDPDHDPRGGLPGRSAGGRVPDRQQGDRPEREDVDRLEERMDDGRGLLVDEEAEIRAEEVPEVARIDALALLENGDQDERAEHVRKEPVSRDPETLAEREVPAEGLECAPEDESD